MAHSQFIGKWQEDLTARKGYDEFMDAVGLKEAKETYRNAVTTITYNVDGDTWTANIANTAFPGVEKKYSFTAGKSFQDKGMDGSDVKATVNAISNCEINEIMENNSEDGKWRTYEVQRKITGNKMEIITSCGGTKMTGEMKRV